MAVGRVATHDDALGDYTGHLIRTIEHPLAGAHQRAADEAGGEPADEDQEQQHHQEAEPRNAERQVAGRVVAVGNQPARRPVEEVEDLPDDEEGDADRCGDDDAGEEIGAQPGEQRWRPRHALTATLARRPPPAVPAARHGTSPPSLSIGARLAARPAARDRADRRSDAQVGWPWSCISFKENSNKIWIKFYLLFS